MKDIAILLQSRDRPGMLKNTIDMLYSTCSSKDNFDIISFIDDDQIEMYKHVIDIYPNIMWVHPKHQPNSWYNLITAQHDFIKKNNYYFVWTLIDDFWGLGNDWDLHIIKNKHYFIDDIFTMHQSKENCHGRYQYIFEKSYIIEGMKDGWSLLSHCELLPIHTKKWVELMSPIFKGDNYTSQQELITASLILLLKKRFNINRLIKCDLTWEGGIDQRKSNSIINSNNGLNRTASFLNLTKDWSDLEPVLDNIVQQIRN